MADGKVSPDDCVDMLKALADGHRWRMVQTLLRETLSVSELGERLDMPQYNVSKHLAILREAGIVVTERDGKTVLCSVAPAFRAQLKRNDCRLDLGCCAFDFNKAAAR
jgi:DNA-binding transcriptional ArsR family regulator